MRRTSEKRDWKAGLLTALQAGDSRIPYASVFRELKEGKPTCGIHLAVLVEPYLSLILEGKKTIESRFSVNRHAPFEQVGKGDIIILKKSSGPIVGICKVADAWFYRLDPDSWPDIDASLMRIEGTVRVPSFDIDKLDPRGWVVLHSGASRAQECLF
jgi:hypothetical protein